MHQETAVYDYVEIADLSKAYQNQKRKLDIIPQPFSEIIKLKFGRKMP